MSFYNQINDERPMIRCSDMEDLNLDDGYSIVPSVHSSWKTASKRLLVIVESVDSLDLRNQELLSGDTEDSRKKRRDERSTHNPMRAVLSNILDLGIKLLKPYGINVENNFAFGIANFNAKKIRDLDLNQQLGHFPLFTKRIKTIISRLKPTHVLVCGDTASHYLLEVLKPDGECPEHHLPPLVAENSEYKRGWVFRRKIGSHPFIMVPTLDLESLYNPSKKQFEDDDDEDNEEGDSDRYAAADLLFFVTRNICNLFNEKMLHDLSDITPKPVYIDTTEKFDNFYAKLLEAEMVSTDLETKALTNTNNQIYMAQFALSRKRTYCIPIRHPKTPFSDEEADYVEKKLRRWLLQKKSQIIITLNGTFDTRIFRTRFDMPIIPYHRMHEVTAGEQLLDENLGLFGRFKLYYAGRYVKTSYQNLRNLFCLYGNDFYYRAKFSKEERHLVGTFEPDDPDVLDYCAMDCQSIFGMAEEQFLIAENQIIKPNMKAKRTRYSAFFSTHLHYQMSNTVQAISHMEQTGSPIDIEYMRFLMDPQKSPLIKVINDTKAELTKLPNVMEASKRILKKAGKATMSLFGDEIDMNVFDPGKKEHKEVLLFDVMDLPVINLTKTKQRAIDKFFTAAYRDKHKEVSLLEQISKAKHLLGTSVKAWVRHMEENVDSAVDWCLRPAFGFFTIVTGRLNSFKPSLQQVPNHGAVAHYIKRAFVPPVGFLNVKYDYSAHEVKGWSFLSGDQKIADSFQAGLDLRRDLVQASDVPPIPRDEKNPKEYVSVADLEEALKTSKAPKKIKRWLKVLGIFADLKKKGDVHISNVHRFFGIWVEKKNPLREAVKKIIFGLIYGKSVRTLSKDIDKTMEETEEIVDKLFGEFEIGAQWLEDARTLVEEHAHVVSPIGRVRRLWRVYTGKNGVIAAAHRRAQNSPIQGLASEIGCSAAFLILRTCYEYIKEAKLDFDTHMPKYCRAVHDANYFIVPFAFVLPFIHIMAYMSTNGVTDWYAKMFNFKLTIEPEIELEVCASEDKAYKWDYQLPLLLKHLYSSLEDLVKIGRLKESEVARTFEVITYPWRDQEYRKVLQERWPILNVKDLDMQIDNSLSLFETHFETYMGRKAA